MPIIAKRGALAQSTIEVAGLDKIPQSVIRRYLREYWTDLDETFTKIRRGTRAIRRTIV